ncbi:peptidase T [Peptoniphilus sp.]|jgi:tripeptide aminopeptidase|uniref:peptidase T n=1 Tax=Peptoniphilus sp. TaxID=1971214 RepID=UPI003D8B22F2
MDKLIERFLKYVSIETTSDETSETTPSTDRQLNLAKVLLEELKEMGLDAHIDENGYVYGKLEGKDKNKKKIGFISHMDTAPDMTAKDVKPNIIENYDGKDIVLNDEFTTKVSEFPFLKKLKGETIITTDGTTLLGADDKAGIAIIMTAIDELINDEEGSYGDIRVGFTPDEEIGRGADKFNVKEFDADFAYTIDGGKEGELEYENFNAARADIVIQGKNVHPGSSKDTMVNSMAIAFELDRMLPVNERPQFTEGYEGFFHMISIDGSVEETKVSYIIRDHSKEKFEFKKNLIEDIGNFLNLKYGERVTVEVRDEYYNMKEKIAPHMEIVELAKESIIKAGVTPLIEATRGGTDGSKLSYMGLPCPNIFTGGYNYHGRYELVSVDAMRKAVETVKNIANIGIEK